MSIDKRTLAYHCFSFLKCHSIFWRVTSETIFSTLCYGGKWFVNKYIVEKITPQLQWGFIYKTKHSTMFWQLTAVCKVTHKIISYKQLFYYINYTTYLSRVWVRKGMTTLYDLRRSTARFQRFFFLNQYSWCYKMTSSFEI